MKKIYLVDVSSLFFRSYYAIPSHLNSPSGLPTNALYGFLGITIRFLREYSSKHIVYCFDHKKPSFRLKIYSEYKANREEMPEDLQVQIPYIKKLTTALGIPSVEKAGYEADDLIGSLALRAKKQKFKVIIVSGDKDFAQIVDSSITLYDPMREISYDKIGVQKKWGILPKQMIDYLALVGDSSDNIPGVFGIGPKGAIKLLEQYGTLEKMYQKLKDIPNKMAEKLKASKKEAFLSQKLAQIVCDVDLKKEVPSFEKQEMHAEQLRDLLKELGFKTFEKKLFPENKSDQSEKHTTRSRPVRDRLPSNLKVHECDWKELKQMIQSYSQVWVFSVGTDHFLSYKNRIISLKGHDLQKIGHWFSDIRVAWCGHDLKKIWKQFDCTHPVPHWCSMMGSYLIESSPPGNFSQICERYLDCEINDATLPGEYYQAHKILQKKLISRLTDLGIINVYQEVELPLITVLFEMERKGISIDKKELKNQAQEVKQQLLQLEEKIFDYSKHEFNLSSPKQLADVLFKEMGLNPIRKTKTGYSTDNEVLNKLKEQHQVIPFIIKHRELFKLKTTYLEALPPLVKKETGRIHTHFRQALTSTGRLSSIHPNLQNIPIKTQQGKKVRRAFVAPKGFQLISADYSQIELRILAHITEDPALCTSFANDLDIHQATASEIYSVPIKKVDANLRRCAKAINFGLIYGQGAYSLSESLGISVAEAKDIIKRYFQKFRKVREYMESVVEEAKKAGYVSTLFGRRRFIKELSASRFQIKKFGERVAINTPVQGTASDLVKMAMIQLRNNLYSPILLQIHDELLFECETALIEEESEYIKKIMENVVSWKVPLRVNISKGKNWEIAHSS